MSVLVVVLPFAMVFAAAAVVAFVTAVRRGQYDDLDSPPWRILFDDTPSRAGAAEQKQAQAEKPSPLTGDAD